MQILEAAPDLAATPSVASALLDSSSASLLERRRFTVREFEQLYRKGLLGPEERVELIEGELIRMSPIGNPHNWITMRLTWMFQSALMDPPSPILVQGGLTLDAGSKPQPDLAILRGDLRDPEIPVPTAVQVLLVIEVSDTTLRNDLGPKARLYAKHGIPEYWVFDVEGGRVVVHRDPTPAGYRTRLEARPPEVLAPLAFPHAGVDLAEVFRGVAKG